MTAPARPAEAPARPLTPLRCWQYAGDHVEAAKALLADAEADDFRAQAAAHIGLAQVYATLLAAAVAAHHPGSSRPPAGALTALAQAMYDPDEV